MILYYKDENDEFKELMDMKEGIWRVAKIPSDKQKQSIGGKEFNFIHESDLPKALNIATFIPYRSRISNRLFKYIDSIECYGLSADLVLKIIENEIEEGVKNG